MFVETIAPELIEKLPKANFDGEIHVIDKPGKEMDSAIRYLKTKKVIGFDTESRPCFSAGQPQYGTSLLQLSGAEKAFLFRIKLTGIDQRLRAILANPDIIKVGAAVTDDIRGLKKFGNFKEAGFVDLQKIVGDYGIRDKSVKKMAAIILGVKISKTQQLSNWEAERLSEAQQKYAATDAWICRVMYKRLLKSGKPVKEESDDKDNTQER